MAGNETEKNGFGVVDPTSPEAMFTANYLRMLGQERGGAQAEITYLKNPGKLKAALDLVTAVSVGLSVTRMSVRAEMAGVDPETNLPTITEIEVPLIEQGELMQTFMHPDMAADRSGGPYYAKVALEQAVEGSAREDLVRGEIGPGRYSREEAEQLADHLIKSNPTSFPEEDRDELVRRCEKMLKPETLEVIKILRERAPRLEAMRQIWGAHFSYASTSGDEEAGAKIFITPGHAAPKGVDWIEFYTDEGDLRDAATRQIYAAGLTYDELVAQKKEDLLVNGLHYSEITEEERERMAREARNNVPADKRLKLRFVDVKGKQMVVRDINVYADGWNSTTFKAWIGAVVGKTGGDLMAAYDAWYAAIATGLIAKVGCRADKEKPPRVGDPPSISSLDAWLMHFRAKQMNEAGLSIDGRRFRWNIYRGKTGPVAGIGKYDVVRDGKHYDGWIGSFFDMATVKNGDGSEVSVFAQWWDEGVKLGKINWLTTDRPDDSAARPGESEVGMNSFDGFLYTKFQLFKLFAAIQGTPQLKDLSAYTYWDGMARSLDKAFGVVYKPKKEEADKEWEANCRAVRLDSRTTRRREFVRDGVTFVQVVPDSENPRCALFATLLARYCPVGALKLGVPSDMPTSVGERFSFLSEFQTKTSALDPKILSMLDPGTVFLENFIMAYISSGMLRVSEAYDLCSQVYKQDSVDKLFKNSPYLRSLLENDK